MSIIGSNILAGASGQGGGYTIERSVRLRSSASAYFNRTLTTPTLGTKWTWSGWVKRGSLGSSQTLFSASSDVNNWGYFGFLSGDTLTFSQADAGSVTSTVTTTQVFRDPSSWYHIIVVFDSTQATAANRLNMYVNGSQITAFGTATYLSQNTASRINQATAHQLGRYFSAANYLDGYLTEINFIDGQALTPSSFGETDAVTGVWKPKKYVGTYGTNGFYLNFSDNTSTTTIGYDYSGNGNNWTANNISLTSGVTYDSMTDVPTLWADGNNGRGNYCVVNPLDGPTNGSFTISDGNLTTQSTSSANRNNARATFGMTTGKWYFEVTRISGDRCQVGIELDTATKNDFVGYDAYGWGIYQLDGYKYNNNVGTAYGSAWATASDVLMVAFDADNGKLFFGKNGTWFASGDPAAGTNAAFTGLTSGPYFPAIGDGSGAGVYAAAMNFGQRPFAYTPPTGFKPLHTGNLPDSAIVDGSDYFNAVTWVGDGAASKTITSLQFQPDLVWIKRRDASGDHGLYDVLRSREQLRSNTTDAGVTAPTDKDLISINSNGHTWGLANFLASNGLNVSNVVWNWKANGAGVSNTDGSITSTVSASPTAGFSIVQFTGNGTDGATVGHGLNSAPEFSIIKNRDTTTNWDVTFEGISGGTSLNLDTTSAVFSPALGYHLLGATTLTLKNGGSGIERVNTSTQDYIAYCFSSVEGYSKFGSYTGNGSADGPFVYLGFRPAFVMIKSTSTGGWSITDTSRDTYNLTINKIEANSALSEAGNAGLYQFDVLSNGFKLRQGAGTGANNSGQTYIYAAFAENPFKNSLAR